MPIYTKGEHDAALLEVYQTYKDALTGSDLISEDHIELIARLLGSVFEDGTKLPISEFDRWVEMGIIKVKKGRKLLVLPDDLNIEDDMNCELLALWFSGLITHELKDGQSLFKAAV